MIYVGLSAQDCVELRRYFRIPPPIQAKTKVVPVTLTYMWNDRDCNEKNFFLCERPLSDGIYKLDSQFLLSLFVLFTLSWNSSTIRSLFFFF